MKKLLIIAPILLVLGAGCVSNVSAPVTGGTPDQAIDTTPIPNPVANGGTSAGIETINPNPPAENKPMPKTWKFPGALPSSEIHGKQIHISTSKGDIVFKLYDGDAPKTVSNFVYLTNGGYYDGLTFHRREERFVIQGGDPNGNGTGGPGYQFEDEKVTRKYNRGIVAMANAGPNTNGSQFFIMLADNPLPPAYTVFGEVTQGIDVVDKIKVGDVMTKVTVEAAK